MTEKCFRGTNLGFKWKQTLKIKKDYRQFIDQSLLFRAFLTVYF